MNRQQKRQQVRQIDKARVELQKLSPEAIRVIEQYARQEAEEKLDLYKKMVDDAVFNAMRCNRISEQRAYRVMEQANKLMVEELNKEVKAVS
jgi:hypothetical protein